MSQIVQSHIHSLDYGLCRISVISSYSLDKSLVACLELRQCLHIGEKQETAPLCVSFCACNCKQDTNDPFYNAACRLGNHWRTWGWQIWHIPISCSPRLADSIEWCSGWVVPEMFEVGSSFHLSTQHLESHNVETMWCVSAEDLQWLGQNLATCAEVCQPTFVLGGHHPGWQQW